MLSAVVSICVAPLVLFIPMFLLYTTRWTVDPATNATIAVLSYRPHYPFPPEVARNIVAIVIGVLMPTSVFIVIVSSVLVVAKLGAARKMRKEMSNSQSETRTGQSEAKITKMLLSVCFLFIILMMPETVGTLVNYILPEFGLGGCYHNTFNFFFRVVSVASCLNSSVNFIAYVSLSARFRATLRQILHCCEAPASDTLSSTTTTSVSHLTCT